VSHTAADYLRDTSLAMTERYAGDCRQHAYKIAKLLIAEGRSPWIARIRETVVQGDNVFHAPLTPRRLFGDSSVTWTTHYVACAGGEAYDPIIGEPVPLEGYTERLFGREISVDIFLDCEATEQFLEDLP
jgi:hypothetical protein